MRYLNETMLDRGCPQVKKAVSILDQAASTSIHNLFCSAPLVHIYVPGWPTFIADHGKNMSQRDQCGWGQLTSLRMTTVYRTCLCTKWSRRFVQVLVLPWKTYTKNTSDQSAIVNDMWYVLGEVRGMSPSRVCGSRHFEPDSVTPEIPPKGLTHSPFTRYSVYGGTSMIALTSSSAACLQCRIVGQLCGMCDTPYQPSYPHQFTGPPSQKSP